MQSVMLATGFMLCMAGIANAGVEEENHPTFGEGALTVDTDKGLKFLDVTFTKGQSYTQISTELCGVYQGFRFATEEEVLNLVGNAGFIPDNYSEDTLSGLVGMLGVTAQSSGIYSANGMVESGDATRPKIVRIMDYPTTSSNRDQIRTGQTVPRDYSASWYGAFLVKTDIFACNEPPVADAGGDQSVIEIGTTVLLDGTQSWDNDGDDLAYSWQFLAKPDGSEAVLSDVNIVNPTFTADVNDEYTIELTVSDGSESSTDQVVVSFNNIIPVAHAGTNHSIVQGDCVCFDGSGSDENLDPLTYSWELDKPKDSTVELVYLTTETICITADLPGTYTATLTVNDGLVDSEPSTAAAEAISYFTAVTGILQDLTDAINVVDLGDFKNKNMQNTLTSKVNAVIGQVEQGAYAEAAAKLRNDIIAKTDGCATSEPPASDKNDWIKECDNQEQIYNLIEEVIDYLESMM